jgi:XTP/dITP diphosphohydrolase
MEKIIVATGNQGKLSEIREILFDLPFELVSMREHWNPLPEIEENGSTFIENACIKADWVYSRTGIWAMADDSGLEVDALSGAPGVKSARYAGAICNNEANNRKLLSELQSVPSELRTARFKCVIALKTAVNCYVYAEGTCEGRIGFEPRGSGGFGYDPLFIPVGEDLTFAEIGSEMKNRMSHRGKALRMLREKIDGLYAR